MASVAASEPVSAETAVLAAESRSGAILGMLGLVILAGVLVFIRLTFAELVEPRWLLDLWLVGMLSVMGFLVVATMLYFRRRPDDAEIFGYWARLGHYAQTGINIGIALSPWILLPNAEPALRYLMVILYVWFLSTEIMTSDAAVPVPAWQIVMLTASTAGFTLWAWPPYALIEAALVILIGGTMLGFRTLVRRGTIKAVEARVASERAEAATRIALAVAAAERDAKTRFIASASHDLQQPLQAAALYFENAVGAAAEADRSRAVEGTRAAFASTQALIGQMLDHLRLEAGAVTARPVPVALAPLLAEVAAEHRPAAAAAGMRIRTLPTGLVAVADPALLRRALSNLVANAVRHACGERILIGARRQGGTVKLWTIDDGSGVAPGDRERLFDDYAQGAGSAPGGFGLGLASVRRAMVSMGGAADFEPRWTGGAAFWLAIPVAHPERLCDAA